MTGRVLIIQEHLPHYRAAFFERLRVDLKERGLKLDLVYGVDADSRMLTHRLEWATAVKIRRLGPFRWHCLGSMTKGADIIVVPQELKYLRCLLLLVTTRFSRRIFAYWGHGRNFQAGDGGRIASWLKRFVSRRVDWWFAYNDLSARIVESMGYPPERITAVGNAIDANGLIARRREIGEAELEHLRGRLGIESANVALFNGAIYEEKRISFLLEAAAIIRQKIPDFHLLVIGEGPQREIVRQSASRYPWIHDLGPMRDDQKVPYWMLCRLLLMPGLVGLVIVDSFALEVPIVTTDYPFHSPEIDYLKNGINGVSVPCGDSAAAYADAVVDLLRDPERIRVLARGAGRSAADHTIEKMVAQFSTGVSMALSRPD